jgi:uncharacterized coiled-coil DUF342 family protein
MTRLITRRKAARRVRRRRSESRPVTARLRELEKTVDQLRHELGDLASRLAARVSELERWSPFVQVHDGSEHGGREHVPSQ